MYNNVIVQITEEALIPAVFLPRTRKLRIVEEVKPANAILETHYRLQTFMAALDCTGSLAEKQLKVLEFCARCGLIANTRMCAAPCAGQMSLKKKNTLGDGYIVRS